MEKVLEVYKCPLDPKNPVVCMDESPKQLIAETIVLFNDTGLFLSSTCLFIISNYFASFIFFLRSFAAIKIGSHTGANGGA